MKALLILIALCLLLSSCRRNRELPTGPVITECAADSTCSGYVPEWGQE